eukprot:gb/GEZN01010842.1/.p1 GENE.gb/GEZN01010842.1/~~gb/GEZN01010842.1/.p1  ORF type:complete len:248 (-),score=29.01 gb/GEZN01010842.1/:465-1133(-)
MFSRLMVGGNIPLYAGTIAVVLIGSVYLRRRHIATKLHAQPKSLAQPSQAPSGSSEVVADDDPLKPDEKEEEELRQRRENRKRVRAERLSESTPNYRALSESSPLKVDVKAQKFQALESGELSTDSPLSGPHGFNIDGHKPGVENKFAEPDYSTLSEKLPIKATLDAEHAPIETGGLPEDSTLKRTGSGFTGVRKVPVHESGRLEEDSAILSKNSFSWGKQK